MVHFKLLVYIKIIMSSTDWGPAWSCMCYLSSDTAGIIINTNLGPCNLFSMVIVPWLFCVYKCVVLIAMHAILVYLACAPLGRRNMHATFHELLINGDTSFKGLFPYIHIHSGLRSACTWTCPLIECTQYLNNVMSVESHGLPKSSWHHPRAFIH